MRVLNYEFENNNGLQLIISAHPPMEFSQINQFELNMLKQNEFDYYLPCHVEVIDNEYKFHYEIYSYKKLQYYMQINCLTQVSLYQFTLQLIDAMQKSYMYMLKPDGCIINMDALFYDEQQKRMMLAYLPVQHKENSVYSFLQWFLYWSNQVTIVDYKHLHQLLSYFMAHDFTLDRIQQLILDYLYQEQIGHVGKPVNNVEPQSDIKPIDAIMRKTVSNGKQELEADVAKNNIEDSRSKENATHTASNEAEFTAEQELLKHETNINHTQSHTLKIMLVCILILCAPLAAWFKLYMEQQSTANFWICTGMTILAVAIMMLVLSKTLLLHKKRSIEVDDLIDEEVTADAHPAFRYYEQDKLKIAATLEQLADQVDHRAMIDHDHDLLIEPSIKPEGKKQRQLDTVKLTHDDATVYMDNNRKDAITLVRAYHHMETQYPLTDEELIIGRSMEGVHINDEYSGVSRLHIQFEYKSGLVIAKDLGSRNGSYLNNKIMTPYKNYVINEMDRIQLISKEGPIYYVKWT